MNIRLNIRQFAGLTLGVGCLLAAIVYAHRVVAGAGARTTGETALDERAVLIESALFTRAEFFGAQALVPYPTLEARNRLDDVQRKLPNDAQVYLKLSHLDEKLDRFELAETEMKRYAELQHDDQAALKTLAAFFHRRAQFAEEAATLENLAAIAPPNEKAIILRELIELARVHRLENFLSPDFYKRIVDRNPAVFEIITQYIGKLVEEKAYAEALKVTREHQPHFPADKTYFITKEASLLALMNEEREAEAVYTKAFDPFWPKELSGSFYEFLRAHDRFRAYGHELHAELKRDPANFDMAVRLHHYAKFSYEEDSSDIFAQVEKARATRGVQWKPEELATCARLLLADGDADAASRFLYTLYAQGEMKPESPLRAAILYQLFELLCDAKDERLALTRGDLKFYKDVATADYHPGIASGILSLIFSDTDPKAQFEKEEARAVKHFNRAAAYRIFNAYKQEYPTSQELAQMYLDIVRLYTATNEPDVASAALDEFEKRYEDAKAYPEVALKLADCYIALGRHDDERALYLHVMDYLGKHRKPDEPLSTIPSLSAPLGSRQAEALDVYSEPTEVHPVVASYPSKSNSGINIQDEDDATENYSDETFSYSNSAYHDYMGGFDAESSNSENSEARSASRRVAYADVLERYVASLAREDRTADILALYSNEIKKYPGEQSLYEQMLQWLGQTNLVEDQLRVYKESLKQFPDARWQDRMARWFLRHERKKEFEAFSRELIEKMNDVEINAYLTKFVAANASTGEKSFDANLYQSLYNVAHERFPHNLDFVEGLLRFYSAHDQWQEWRKLSAEYYFESRGIREQFLSQLAGHNELRAYLNRARLICSANALAANKSVTGALPYKLFRADSAAWLSNYEEAIDAYRELNRLYPDTPEFSERLISFTRSFGQHNRKFLEEAAAVQISLANAAPASIDYRTRAGEIYAELGDYSRAKAEWEKLIEFRRGESDTYLQTATIYWDYFQYADALRTINELRASLKDQTLYAFQTGAILEAQHQTREALAEYAKALDEENADYSRVKRRLVILFRQPGIAEQFDGAFEVEAARRRDGSSLVLGYVELLKDAHQWKHAATLLRGEVARSRSQSFLDRARDAFIDVKDTRGEQAALKRLIAAASSPRFAISYRLQLADAFNREGEQRNAASVLDELLRKFPANYGVLNEATDFYWRMGMREDSLRILQASYRRGKGKFHYIFARKLAARESEMNRTGTAESVLAELHAEDKLDTDVFHELARIYVHTSNRDALKRIFRDTLDAIKAQDVDVKEMRGQIAELRAQMIEAFTKLNDYAAAIEQHIEIINRNPEDEERVEAAIAYAKRYGGADALLAYYLRTAGQAYKNYRWNIVLARIYDAKNDLPNAAQNYRLALQNQPEMLELYDALASVEMRLKNYDAALEMLNKAAELSNDDPQRIKRIIEVLEKAGRHREAEIARRRLPEEELKRQSVTDQFDEAARLRVAEKSQAAEAYRKAFESFATDPFKHDLKAAEITGYVQTVRDEENLDRVTQKLWTLRAMLIAEAERSGSTRSGKARDLLQTLDGVIPEAVGGVADGKATGDELAALFQDLRNRIDSALREPDPHGTLSLLQNLSRRAGFGALEEQILLAQTNAARASGTTSLYHARLRSLVDFFSECGDYKRIVELLETESARDQARGDFEYSPLIAENARLINDPVKELQALRNYYRRASGKLLSQPDSLVERYFEALEENAEEGRAELLSSAQHPSPFHIQLINFLLAREERELAREAIEYAPLPLAWKLSRTAEASLALRDYDARNETYFEEALQYKTVGELINEKPDAAKQLVGDDWFSLAEDYGRWLALRDNRNVKSRTLLPAMIENRPHDESEQMKLGHWHMEHNNPQQASEHFQLALEIKPDDKSIIANLGSAYFLAGDTGTAEAWWSRVITGDTPQLQDCVLYLRTLVKHGLGAAARKKLFPAIVAHIENASRRDDESYGVNKTVEFDKVKPFIRQLAQSFAGSDKASGAEELLPVQVEAARAAFFRKLCEALPHTVSLPEMLITESLIAKKEQAAFYHLLIERSEGLSRYDKDYEFVAQLGEAWSDAQAEQAFDHSSKFKPSEPSSKRIEWQKEYLERLLDEHETVEARHVIASVEAEIKHRYVRPAWLRLMKLQLEIRDGRSAQACEELKTFTGIKTSARIAKIEPPDTERLNDAVAMLRLEGRESEAGELLEAAYARRLALEQYEASSFIGLARLYLAKNDAASGLKLLQAMIDLGQEERAPAASAELAALPQIKIHAVDDPAIEKPLPRNDIELRKALQFASEIAAGFGHFDAAIVSRKQLLKLAPEDETNCIELARLFAANKQSDDAISCLASIIADRHSTRRARWQAVWIAPEIAEEKGELWETLRQRVQSADPKDIEIITALNARALSITNRTDEAVKLISSMETNIQTSYAAFFRALLEQRANQDQASLSAFIDSLVADRKGKSLEALGFSEDSPLRQVIRLYLLTKQPRAALKLADSNTELKTVTYDHKDQLHAGDADDAEEVLPTSPEQVSARRSSYRTLDERVSEHHVETQTELSGLLSEAAEQTGDLVRAVEFEKAKLDLISSLPEKRAAETRLSQLLARQKENSTKQKQLFRIDRNFITRR